MQSIKYATKNALSHRHRLSTDTTHAQCDVERRSCTKYGLMPGSPLRGLGSVEVDPFVEVA